MHIDFYPVTRRRRRRRRTLAEQVRHARNYCRICSHARRAEIEQDFLNWRDPHEIVREYELVHHSVIYRHANALGLMAPRSANARVQLDAAETDDGRWNGHPASGAARPPMNGAAGEADDRRAQDPRREERSSWLPCEEERVEEPARH